MLRLLATSGRVLSRQDLMGAIWPNVHVGDDSLFQCIRELRAALGDDRRQLIKLASGGGYLLTAEVVAAPVGQRRVLFGLRARAAIAGLAGLAAIVIGLAVAAPVLIGAQLEAGIAETTILASFAVPAIAAAIALIAMKVFKRRGVATEGV